MSIPVEDLMRMEIVNGLDLHRLMGKEIPGVSTDSRTTRRGEIFFALRGEAFDGHDFVLAAFKRGAVAAVVEEISPGVASAGRPVLVVRDTTKAMGSLAAMVRRRFPIPFIAVAGSNGKTTTKEMIAAVLATQYTVLHTAGNLNNHIGLPQMLFRLTRSHEIAVLEIGTNHFGELEYLCSILQPTEGIVTNIGREHMEFFRTLSGVARAEGELFASLRKSGKAYVNRDDAFVVKAARTVKQKMIYGFSPGRAGLRGRILAVDGNGCITIEVTAGPRVRFRIKLSVPGKHLVQNALAAAAVGLAHGISPENIRRALKRFRAVGKRMEVTTVGGVRIVNDTYNANPDSVRAALETLSLMRCSGKRVVILADMLELGKSSAREHRNIGRAIDRREVGVVLTFGPMARLIAENAQTGVARHFRRKRQLADFAGTVVLPGDLVLVKGSRGMKMEEIVKDLQKTLGRKAA